MFHSTGHESAAVVGEEDAEAAGAYFMEDQESEWAEPVNWLTLCYDSKVANKLFYEDYVVKHLAPQDRHFALLTWTGLLLLGIRFGGWTPYSISLLLLIVTWLALLFSLAAMNTPTTRQLYVRHRTWIMTVGRLSSCAFFPLVHNVMVQTPAGSNPIFFLAKLLLNSCSLSLATLSMGAVIPFHLHLLCMPFMLAAVWAGGSLHVVSSKLCEFTPAEMNRVHSWLTHWAAAVQPMCCTAPRLQQVVLACEQCCEAAPNHTPPRCPGVQLVLFIQLAVGAVLPTVLLYRNEWRARLHYLRSQAPGLSGMRGVRHVGFLLDMHSYWLRVAAELTQLYVFLAVLWWVLDGWQSYLGS